jgi:NADPH:quinone reductase-like Zn-dependent oxidoreductase
MRKIIFEQYGKPADILKVHQVEMPSITADEVLIKVTASPINPSDIMFVQNLYGIRPQLPSPAGFEGVGTIVEAGTNTKLPTGIRVSFTGIGAWSEYVVADKKAIIPIPDTMTDDIAAQLFVNPFTAVAMVEESGVQPGEWLLITACGSALGKMTIQLCKMRGIKTIGTVRRNDINNELSALGIDAIVNIAEENLPKRVKEITGGVGARAAIEAVGGETASEALKCLSRGGLMLIYGLLSLQNPVIDSGLMIFKELNIKGFWLTDWMRRVDAVTRVRTTQEVITLLASGQIQLPIEASYSLEQIAQAATHADSPGRWGKVLVKP